MKAMKGTAFWIVTPVVQRKPDVSEEHIAFTAELAQLIA
jgi:hypothetical protein